MQSRFSRCGRILLLPILLLLLSGCQAGPAAGTGTPDAAAPLLSTPDGAPAAWPDYELTANLGRGLARSAQYDPTGRWLAISTSVGAYLYHATSYRQAAVNLPRLPADRITFSPDGRYLALSLPDLGEIQVWDLQAGALLRALPAAPSTLLTLTFLADGTSLLAVTFVSAELWQVDSGALLQTITPADGMRLAESGVDGTGALLAAPLVAERGNQVQVWRLADGGSQALFQGPEHTWYRQPVFSPAKEWLALLAGEEPWDGSPTILLWNMVTDESRRLTGPADVVDGAWYFYGEGEGLAVGYADGTVILWSTVTGNGVRTLAPPAGGRLHSLRYVAASGRLVAAYDTGQLQSWQLPDGPGIRHDGAAAAETLTQLAAAPAGGQLALVQRDGAVAILDVTSNRPVTTLDAHTHAAARDLAFTADGQQLAAGLANGRVPIWDGARGDPLGPLPAHSGRVDAVAFAPDGASLATGMGQRVDALTFDDSLRLWRRDGTVLWRAAGEQEAVAGCSLFRNRIAYTPDGALLAATSHDFTVQLWETADGSRLRTLTGHTASVMDLAISADGTLLASASEDGTVRIWRLADGALLQTLTGRSMGFMAVAFAPDGNLLAAGTFSGELSLWDVVDGRLLRLLDGGGNPGSDVRFTPDGGFVVAGSGSTLRAWSVASGLPAADLPGGGANVTTIALSPDGRRLAFGSLDGNVSLWHVP